MSGASQHIGGLGNPRHVVSVNTDPSCPMTAMADLGLICDAGGLLVRLAQRLGVPSPPSWLARVTRTGPARRRKRAPSARRRSLRPNPRRVPEKRREASFMPEHFDAVVVGAGPAGSAAALALARAGRSVVLVERGPFPGSKNVYGGVVYARVLDEVIPRWWEQVPVQRWVVRRSTMVMTPTQAVTVDVRTQAWGETPYNGMTTYRADFDSWLAGAGGGRRSPAGHLHGGHRPAAATRRDG